MEGSGEEGQYRSIFRFAVAYKEVIAVVVQDCLVEVSLTRSLGIDRVVRGRSVDGSSGANS